MNANTASSTGLNELAGNSPSVINSHQPGIAPAVAGEPVAVSPAANPPGAGEVSNPLGDIASLRLGQDFSTSLGLSQPRLTVPVGKPPKAGFIQVHPSEDYRLQTAVIELREEGEIYLVAKPLWPHLGTESTFGPRVLFTALSRPGNVLFLWPIRLPGADGRLDSWNRSALTIATSWATKNWVRVISNRALGAYEALVAANTSWGSPQWPDTPFAELLKVAFKDRFIDHINHPVLQRLRGEA